MPITKIYTNFELKDKEEFVNGFHGVMRSVLKIPDYDRLVILDESRERFFQPTDTEGPYILYELTLFKGRSLETKRTLYRALTRYAEELGIPPSNTRTILYEVEQENRGIRGGQAASDLQLGFQVDL